MPQSKITFGLDVSVGNIDVFSLVGVPLRLTCRRYSLPSGQSYSVKIPNLLYDRLMIGSIALDGGCSESVRIIQNLPANIRDFDRRKVSVEN